MRQFVALKLFWYGNLFDVVSHFLSLLQKKSLKYSASEQIKGILVKRAALAMDIVQHYQILNELIRNGDDAADIIASHIMAETALRDICQWVSHSLYMYTCDYNCLLILKDERSFDE